MIRRAFLALVLALAPLTAAVPAMAFATGCAEDQIDLRGPWGQARFTVEIADTDASRAQGLMHRERLARSAGMLFIFERPDTRSFWMRNTLIPLDMLFIDPVGRVVHIHHEAIPLDETPIPSRSSDVLMVLEINGGLARALGIGTGSEIRHPRLASSRALWPCN